MKLDGAIIPIEQRRSAGACLDLAMAFYRAHARGMLGLTLLFAVPSSLLGYWIADEIGGALAINLLLFLIGSPFLGAVLAAAAGRRVFGEPFAVGRALGEFASRSFLLAFVIIISRLGIGFLGMVFFLPGLYIAIRYGFLAEVILLEQIPAGRFERRISDLIQGASVNLALSLSYLILFLICASMSLFVMADLAGWWLLGLPILIGRVTSGFYSMDMFINLLSFDPAVAAALTGSLWLVYPLARLAWFFNYLDIRIRKECWDVELAFRVEARRLEAAA